MSEQAVLVYLPAAEGGLSLDLIEDPLIDAIDAAGVGEFDGHENGPEHAILFMYGPDADALFQVIAPILQRMELPTGSYAVKRYDPLGPDEVRVGLDRE